MVTVRSTHPRAGRVTLVGRPNVGKSTLLNALLGEPISITSPHPQTTREPVCGILTIEQTQYVFVDTPGVHAPRSRLGQWMNDASHRQAQEADAVVLVTDAPARPGPLAADLALAAQLPRVPAVLVANKIDRLKDMASLLPYIAAFTEAHSFAATIPISSTRQDGLDRLLDELRVLLPEQPFLYEPDTLSDKPERFFVAEFVREQVLSHTRQEVPHGVAVMVERFDEAATPTRIEATIIVARESHAKIVIGAKGSMLKSIGTAARARVERALGRHVYLGLRVRAAPGWMNDEERLAELGYGGWTGG